MMGKISWNDRQGRSLSGARFDTAILDIVPAAVMVCDLPDFTISYLNRESYRLLKSIEAVLPVPADDVLGQSIDIFHKNPAMQRAILSDPDRLPHTARIRVADEVMDLSIVARFDPAGKYLGPVLLWNVVTDAVRAENEVQRMAQMIEQLPMNVMFLDTKTFDIQYMNPESLKTLKKIEEHLPCKAEDVVGSNVDIFHKNPGHQRQMLADPSRLPHRGKIKVGPETLDLRVHPVMDRDGGYMGAMATWSVITREIELTESILQVADSVNRASSELKETTDLIFGKTEESSYQADAVSAATEQLSSSILEISRQVARSSDVSTNAVDGAERIRDRINGLATDVESITEVVELITKIAGQTNLLALNATIEAARAGEAGKGFAVVASEVKGLAVETERATKGIGDRIQSIQDATSGTVEAIQAVAAVISEMSEISATISAAVEQQTAATREVSGNISGVSDASRSCNQQLGGIRTSMDQLTEQAAYLDDQVKAFIAHLEG